MALALGLQALPVPEALRWLPDDPWAFAPRLLRPGGAPGPAGAVPGEVDEAELLALDGEPAAGEPSDAPTPPPGAGESPEAPEAASGLPTLVLGPGDPLPRPPRLRHTQKGLPLLPIEDPQGNLRRLYTRLRALEGGAPQVVRVLHYGDSLITGDLVTRTLRRLLQRRFGDAGHGFVLAGRPAPWYRRDNLRLTASDGWEVFRLTKPKIQDGRYGLGGVTVQTSAAGEWVRFEPTGDDQGARVSRLQVFYLAHPRGGRFALEAGERSVEIDTRAPEPEERTAELGLPDGPHSLRLRTLGRGTVRLFGAVLERAGPGVAYDALGLDGARVRLLRKFDPPHWHRQLHLRRPDLIILQYGTNESEAAHLGIAAYAADLSEIIGHLRAALPGVACLVVSPLDRAWRDPKGKLVTRPVVPRIVAAQREVALRQGCAFFDTFRAMGGEGAMVRWYAAKPPLASGDLTHPTWRGAERVGAMLFAALMEGLATHAPR